MLFAQFIEDFTRELPLLSKHLNLGQSDAFTAAYERNLTGFIKDIRSEFNQPDLPFVIAALGQGGAAMRPNARKVHDAQIAVGKVSGNVTSIDTIPFFFPKEESPGGRESDYHHNVDSFLLIGEAMGREMLRLVK